MKLKEYKTMESKYNQAQLDQYLMGIKQMNLDKKLDFKKYFTNSLTSNTYGSRDSPEDSFYGKDTK